jgi:hypothetical protein
VSREMIHISIYRSSRADDCRSAETGFRPTSSRSFDRVLGTGVLLPVPDPRVPDALDPPCTVPEWIYRTGAPPERATEHVPFTRYRNAVSDSKTRTFTVYRRTGGPMARNERLGGTFTRFHGLEALSRGGFRRIGKWRRKLLLESRLPDSISPRVNTDLEL